MLPRAKKDAKILVAATEIFRQRKKQDMDFDIQMDPTPCAACGERPGVVSVTFFAGGQRRQGSLCERCARLAVSQGRGGAPLPPAMGGGSAAGATTRARPGTQERSATPTLDGFGRDLTAEARAGRIDPVIGREAEIEQVVEALTRRRKNNAALIGEAGVGKTAIAEGLALRVAEGTCPSPCVGCEWLRSTLPGWSPARSTAVPSSSA